MSSVKIRQPPKLTAIPRPIQVTHKPRKYSQLKTTKPKANWSRYNVLPAIHTNDVDDFIKNENDLHEKEPTPYNEISDNEFLFDQMTAELEEMIEREAKLKMIREKAFTQYLELKSDYMDWVIKMAHNDVWVPVKDSRVREKVSINQSPVRDDDLKSNVPSPPACPKGPSPPRGNPVMLVPKPPSYPNVQRPTGLKTDTILFMPPDYPNDQPSISVSTMNTVRTSPTLYPNDQPSIGQDSEASEPNQTAYPYEDSSSCKSTENILPQPSFSHKEKISTGLMVDDVVPKWSVYPKDWSPTRLTSTDCVPQSSGHPKDASSTKHQSPRRASPDVFVPRPPDYPKNQSPMRRSPEASLFVPRPPVGHRGRNSRKVIKPDIVPMLHIPPSTLTPIQELPSSRID